MTKKISSYGSKFSSRQKRYIFNKNKLYTIENKDGVPFGFFKYPSDRDRALKKLKYGIAGSREIPLGQNR